MESRFLSQAAKFLQEQKKNKRWTVVFVCLAAVVALGTVTALKLYGQAMTHKVKVLNCGYEVHTHDEGCYDEDGNLTCVYADYVVHVHNDDCYDPNSGELVCQIPEREPHEHTEECYEEEEVLICGEEESEGAEEPEAGEAPKEAGETEGGEGHEHTEACYTKEKGDLICEIEGHTHDDSCYSETLVCEEAEHTHDDGCYDKVLDCDDDSEEHEHDDGCYTEEFTCEKDEHTHGEGCYEKSLTCEAAEESHEHTDECYAWNEVLTCTSEEGKSEEKKEEEKPEEKKEEDKGEKGHTHTDECYKTEKVLTCGELELHTHDDSCYEEDCFDEEGNLIEGSVPTCGLLQLEEHVHTGDCFKEIELTADEIAALNAGAVLHIHVDSCYDENGNLICGHDATHIHNTECYDADGNLICGYAGGHTHDESCYDENGKQICGQKETTHIHNKDCYDEEGNLICGDKDKTHEHGMNCYDKDGNLTCGYEVAKDHEHDVECYDADDKLICGFEGMKDHRHNADCYDEEGNLTCERIVRAHEHEDSCYDAEGNLICGYEEEYHIHTADCYDEEGNLICGYINGDAFENTATYEGDGYIVTAMYNNDAELPEGAELIAEQITAESDAERYTQREAEYQEMVEDEKASMRALFKIGFYVEGEEVEPKSPVAVTIQFLDEDGLAEGKPITVVHFAEEGAKKIDGSNAKDGSTSFKTGSFSEFAIGYSQEKKIEVDENGVLHIDGSFKYDADPFHITFHVKGEAQAPEGDSATDGDAEDETGNDPAAAEEGAADESEAAANNTIASVKAASMTPEDSIQPEEDLENEEQPEISEGGNESTEDPNARLEFMVQELESTEIRNAVLGYFGDTEDSVTRRVLHTLSYKMTYDGVELDLKDCKVTAVITMGAAPADEPADAPSEEAGEDPADTSDGEDAEVSEGAGTEEGGQEDAEAPQDADTEEDAEAPESSGSTDMEDGRQTAASIKSVRAASVSNVNGNNAGKSEDGEEGIEPLSDNASDIDVTVTALEVTADGEVHKLGAFKVDEDGQNRIVTPALKGNVMAFSDEAEANPEFTVQYYTYLQIAERNADFSSDITDSAQGISIIDTSKAANGGEAKLPSNGVTPKTTKLIVEDIGGDKKGILSTLHKVRVDNSLEKIYEDRNFKLLDYPELKNFNKFATEYNHYDLIEVWVLNEGGNSESIDNKNNDWKIYKNLGELQFTNNEELAAKNPETMVYVKTGTIIRLVSESNNGDYNQSALFFDYDITDGKVYSDEKLTTLGDRNSQGTLYVNTKRKGINDLGNYQDDNKNPLPEPHLGFGNHNTGGTGLNLHKNGDYFINQASSGYDGCSFGIVGKKLGDDKLPVFNVSAPDLFGEKPQAGKTVVEGYSLDFKRCGDTYTLSAVNDGTDTTKNLDMFRWRGNWNNTRKLWTNNFWPMDTSAKTYGTDEHDLKFGDKSKESLRNAVGTAGTVTLPIGDDYEDHNSYFGMSFALDFTLTEDYLGPLNYCFFGDDDMWVFLDDTLVCDIGGVHSSSGAYVDLWDYIEKGDTGKHILRFFYTERGASGSTCWMQFTLPSVNTIPVDYPSGSIKNTLTINKGVHGTVTDEKFEFVINFFDKNNQKELINCYNYIIKNGEEEVQSGSIKTGESFFLGNGDSITIRNLPDGAHYTVKEKNYSGYESEINGDVVADHEVNGEINWEAEDWEQANYINKAIPYELPETGGSGMELYTIAGALCLVFGAGFMYRKKFRERRA